MQIAFAGISQPVEVSYGMIRRKEEKGRQLIGRLPALLPPKNMLPCLQMPTQFCKICMYALAAIHAAQIAK